MTTGTQGHCLRPSPNRRGLLCPRPLQRHSVQWPNRVVVDTTLEAHGSALVEAATLPEEQGAVI